MMSIRDFFDRLQTMKDGDAAYIVITKENGKLYYDGEILEER
jgi:hypothetical protein